MTKSTSASRSLRLFTPAEEHDCAYLPGRKARSSYVDPNIDLNIEWLTQLNLQGFRRSGRLVYRPDCQHCNACVSTRILVNPISLSKSQRRVLKRNHDLQLAVVPAAQAGGFYDTYKRYIDARHRDGDMYPASMEQYQDFLMSSFGNSYFLCVYDQSKFIGALAFDVLLDGLSSVYCFFEPNESSRSLGRFLILRLSQLSSMLGRRYNYLGYYVEGCQKMIYKQQFTPRQQWLQNQWQ